MSAPEPVLNAMRSGAGLPVLQVLDRYVGARADGDANGVLPADTIEGVTSDVDAWLDDVHTRLRTRLAEAHAGPLRTAVARWLTRQVQARRSAVVQVRATSADVDEDVAWARLEAEFTRLHTFKLDVSEAHAAAGHLREVARLMPDVCDDAVLSELAALEAEHAAGRTPSEWRRAAADIEARCTAAVDVEPHRPDAHPKNAETTEPEETEAIEPHNAGDGPGPSPSTSPHTPNPQPPSGPLVARVATLASSHRRPTPKRPRTHSTPDAGNGPPAGAAVLDGWDQRTRELARADDLLDGLRHAPLWAPIATRIVEAETLDREDLLAHAAACEIDLVDVELPRVMAVAAGGRADAVRRRLAERAVEITKRDPKRPARDALLDYVTGKLPIHYRDTEAGLALIESISFALATDEPWERPDADIGDVLVRMVAAELDRTPAVDLGALAKSLLGPSDVAHQRVLDAASELATTDDDVTLTDDGILVKPLADAEDPDALYRLREALARTLGADRAAEIIAALITAGGDAQ